MRFLLLVYCCCFINICFSQKIESFVLHSKNVGDSFLIQVRVPKNYSSSSSYQHIYVADGNLKLGKYIMGNDSSWRAAISDSSIIISIGHFGDYRSKRRRDFIPSDAGGYTDKNFGKAHQFYTFLKSELMPLVNKRYVHKKTTAFIGHSFSGLFCLYTLFQSDKLFDQHFAISPSVSANSNELLKIEENYFKMGKQLEASINLQAGGLEIFNNVLSSTNQFYQTIIGRNYRRSFVKYSLVNNANHYSIIKPGVDKALEVLAKSM